MRLYYSPNSHCKEKTNKTKNIKQGSFHISLPVLKFRFALCAERLQYLCTLCGSSFNHKEHQDIDSGR
jgi:hypothetical protein